MPTVTKTWTFNSNVEDWSEYDVSNITTFQFDASGNPNGSVDFINNDQDGSESSSETAHISGTWESIFGVPSGQIVTSIKMLRVDVIVWSYTAWDILDFEFDIKSSPAGTGRLETFQNLYGADALQQTLATWVQHSTFTTRNVQEIAQPSDSAISFTLILYPSSFSGPPHLCDVGFDNISVEVTYGGDTPKISRHHSKDFPHHVLRRKR